MIRRSPRRRESIRDRVLVVDAGRSGHRCRGSRDRHAGQRRETTAARYLDAPSEVGQWIGPCGHGLPVLSIADLSAGRRPGYLAHEDICGKRNMNPVTAIGVEGVAIVSITSHEAAHGFVADRLGDPTARDRGRLTLNPIPHIDLFFTILLPVFLILSNSGFIFGGAKPVPVEVNRLRRPRRDWALVGAAGPAMNVLIAIVRGCARPADRTATPAPRRYPLAVSRRIPVLRFDPGAATIPVAPAPLPAVFYLGSRRLPSRRGTTGPRLCRRLGALLLVARFEVTISGRSWVSTEDSIWTSLLLSEPDHAVLV